jgi:hypothetical protein
MKMRAVMLVLVTVVALLLGGAPMAEAKGGGRSVGRAKTKAIKPHTQRTAKGKRVNVKGYKRAEAQR